MRKIYLTLAMLIFANLVFAQKYQLKNMGWKINSAQSEIAPVLSPDGKTLFFSRSPGYDPERKNRNIRFSKMDRNGRWTASKEMSRMFNNSGWNTVAGITSDGKTILLTGRYMPDGTHNGGFSMSHLKNGIWTMPMPLNIKDFPANDITQAGTLSGDGRTIIFSCNNRFGGKFLGAWDLFVTILQNDGTWSKPENLGGNINTEGFEIAPFIAPDGVTLYFSTEGRGGYGSQDIFMSRRLDDTWTKWSEPVNLGNSVNTAKWEAYFVTSDNGKVSVAGSTNNAMGKMDLFRVTLPEKLKPNRDISPLVKNRANKVNTNLEQLLSGQNVAVVKKGYVRKNRIRKKSFADKSNQKIVKNSSKRNKNQIKTIRNNKKVKSNRKVEKQQKIAKVKSKREVRLSEDNLLEEIIIDDIPEKTEQPKEKLVLAPEEKQTAAEAVETRKIHTPATARKLVIERKLENLGRNINSGLSEMAPVISPDGKTLFFARSKRNDRYNSVRDIYVASVQKNGKWAKAENIGKKINNNGWNVPCGITPDGNKILLTGEYLPNGKLKEGFSMAYMTTNGWSEPKPLKIKNMPRHMQVQAGTISPDGKVIIFPSYRQIGEEFYGTMDLYITFEESPGVWAEPINLGKVVNTEGYETSPFLAADGKSLYFSSDGHGGFGSQDIFVTTRLDNTWKSWSRPENLGAEVNSRNWEAYFTIPASGEYAYVGSRKASMGKMDLYRIKVKNAPKPEPIVIVSGKVIDSKTQKPVEAIIKYETLDLDNPYQGEAKTNPQTGEYKIALNAGSKYSFHAKADGYFGINDYINLLDLEQFLELKRNLELRPIIEGEVVRLNNIFFERGKWQLLPESAPELDKVYDLLIKYIEINIEIGGHTEVGHADKKLSQKRAESVKNYLCNKGISSERIQAVGYGNTKPINDNTTEKKRAMNRRVEFRILGK